MMSEEINGEKVEEASTKRITSYNFLFYMITLYGYSSQILIFYFYEVLVGLPIMLLGIAFIIYAVWNMINDPLAGYLTDRPMKWADKWGIRRPWILVGSIGTILFFFLLMAPPNLDVTSDPWPMFWYMVIITCILDTFFSICTTHYVGGFANQFSTQNERRKASVISRFFIAAGVLSCGVILVPLFIDLGDRGSFMIYGIVVAIIMTITLIITNPALKESPALIARYMAGYEERIKLSFWKVLKGAFKSKYFKLYLFATLMATTGITLLLGNLIFFIKDVLGLDIAWLALFFVVYMISLYGSIPFWNKLAKKIGPTKIFRYGLLAMGLSFTCFLFVTDVVSMIILEIITGICFASYLSMSMVMVADSMDTVTAELGCHQEATCLGVATFFERFAVVLFAIIFTVVHIATGYNPDPNATQTPLATLGVRLITGLFGAIFPIMGGIALVLWWDLDGEKRVAMKTKLRECGL